MADKPIAPPSADELAPVTKGQSVISQGIATSTGGFVQILSPTDSVLRAKGGRIDIYKEVLRDDQVKSTFEQRRRGVLSAEWMVEPGADDAMSTAAAQMVEDNLRRIEFDRITDKALFSIFYGYAVGECIWEIRDNLVQLADIRFRDRARFRFGAKRELFLAMNGAAYEQMPDRKFWVINTGADHDDEPYGMGLAHWLYWPVYFKRNDIKFWLIFLEKFGMPTGVAKLPAGQADDKIMQQKALEVLSAIQTDGGVVVPDGMVLELLEAARSGSADYDGMQKTMDAAIAKVVLSQTMTTDNGSSRSQGEVHERVKDDVVKADADLVCESFNRTVIKWLTEWNYPGAVPPRVYRKTEPPEDLTKRAERDSKIKELGYEPTEEYIEETYGPGWKKSQQSNSLVPGDVSPFQMQPPANAGAEDFAELAAMAAIKSVHRNDQQALVDAASAFAAKYEEIVGPRLRDLVAFAEDSGDYETFRRHLNAMLEGLPSKQSVDKVHRATSFARLLGMFRGQR